MFPATLYVCPRRVLISRQKSCPNVRRRQHTGFLFAEHPVAVFGKKFVGEIAQKSRDEAQTVKPAPRAVQFSGDAQSGGRMRVNRAVFDKNHRIDFGFVNAVFSDEIFADLRLQRSEFEVSIRVAFDDKIHRTVAEIAHAVEKNDRIFVHPSIVKPEPEFSN